MHCNESERSALLKYAKNIPEYRTALLYLMLGDLSDAAKKISWAVSDIASDFADSVIDPKHFHRIDRMTRLDWRSESISRAASACGCALAAFDLLAALSDTYQQNFWHCAEHSYQMRCNKLKEICYLHGYREEDYREEK